MLCDPHGQTPRQNKISLNAIQLFYQIPAAFSFSRLTPCLWPLLRKTFLLSQYLTSTSLSLTKERAILAVSYTSGVIFHAYPIHALSTCLTLTGPCPYLSLRYPARNSHHLRLGGWLSACMMLGNHHVRSSPSQD